MAKREYVKVKVRVCSCGKGFCIEIPEDLVKSYKFYNGLPAVLDLVVETDDGIMLTYIIPWSSLEYSSNVRTVRT
jgi:hypothetical protein